MLLLQEQRLRSPARGTSPLRSLAACLAPRQILPSTQLPAQLMGCSPRSLTPWAAPRKTRKLPSCPTLATAFLPILCLMSRAGTLLLKLAKQLRTPWPVQTPLRGLQVQIPLRAQQVQTPLQARREQTPLLAQPVQIPLLVQQAQTPLLAPLRRTPLPEAQTRLLGQQSPAGWIQPLGPWGRTPFLAAQ